MSAAAVAGIAELQKHAMQHQSSGADIRGIAQLVSSFFAAGAASEAELQHCVLLHATGDRDAFDLPMQRMAQRAEAYLARFGIPLPAAPRGGYGRVSLLCWEDTCTLDSSSYDTINLAPLRDWADASTRRAVHGAIRQLDRVIRAGLFAADLWGSSYYFGEAAHLVSRFAGKRGEVDFDALWKEAIDILEWEEGDKESPDSIYIIGIGNREEFDWWARMMVGLLRDHCSFSSAAPARRQRPRSMREVRDWCRRIHRFCRAIVTDYEDVIARIEPGDYRWFGESTVLLTGAGQGPSVDHYFQYTETNNGEVRGREIRRGAAGRTLQLSVIFALASTAVFHDLNRILQ